MLYCCKDYKKVTRDKKFLRSRFFVCFWGFGISSWNIRIFSSLGLENSISLNIRNFFRDFFYFYISESYFLKYQKFFKISVSLNIRNFRLGVSVSQNIRKAFFWEIIRIFLILEYKKFSRGGFFCFSSFGWKVPFQEI